MRKLFLSIVALFLVSNFKAQPFSFTITNLSGSDTISCILPSINFTLGSNYAPVTYVCTGPNAVLSGTSLSIFSPGIYTITATTPTTAPSTSVTSSQTLAVFSNSTPPNISVLVPNQLLTCSINPIQLQGNSTNSLVTYNWATPSNPAINSATLNVNTITSTPTSTFNGNYTLTVTDQRSGCKSFTVVPMYQNIFSPVAIANAAPSIGPPCIDSPSITLINSSTNGLPPGSGFTPGAALAFWYSPVAQSSVVNASTYQTTSVGIYTLTVKDSNNGCTSSLTLGPCTGINTITNDAETLIIFPNPNTGRFYVKFEEKSLLENYDLVIYNALGSLIKKQKLASNENYINIESLPSDLYFVSLNENDKLVAIRKILKH